jgi:uncharacterized protein with HEPN domain
MTTDPELRLHDYLDHILQAILRIDHYTEELTEITFLEDNKTQDAVIRNIEVIGEAAGSVRRNFPDFVKQNDAIPWGDIYLMRNRVAHGYFSVDLEIVWATIQTDLPDLATQIRALLLTLKR